MSDINQNVNINVNANTQDAGQDISKLENNIKTLDGAVNLVGGSIEVLAGGLAIAGAVTEEQAEKFQTAAVGAIALADGSKRILEGYKTLATETKVLTVIQRIYNTVMKANPLFLIVGVIAAVTLGVIALTKALKNQADEQQRLNDLQSSERLQGFLERSIKLAKARGAETKTILNLELSLAKEREASAKAAIKEAEDQEEAYQKYLNAITDRQIAEINLNEEEKKLEEERATRAEMLRGRQEGALDLKKKEIDFEVDLRKNYTLTANTQMSLEKQKTEVTEAEAAKRKAIAVAEENAKQALLTDGIDNIQGALGALFQENKAVASANVLIDAAQAGVGIIKNSTTTGPFAIAYQATQFALLAATTAASLQQINSAEPGSSSIPQTPRGTGGGIPSIGGVSGPGFNLGLPQTGGTSGVNTISAVVLAGDVTSAQAQEAAIRNRRRFG